MNQGMAGGMTVVARGQVYYHRPGNWNEQPNFFNPYWRPRLASVWQGKDQLPYVEKMLNGLPPTAQEHASEVHHPLRSTMRAPQTRSGFAVPVAPRSPSSPWWCRCSSRS